MAFEVRDQAVINNFLIETRHNSCIPDEFEIPFGENLPFGTYDLNADAVAEVAATNTIYRSRLTTGEKLQVQQGP